MSKLKMMMIDKEDIYEFLLRNLTELDMILIEGKELGMFEELAFDSKTKTGTMMFQWGRMITVAPKTEELRSFLQNGVQPVTEKEFKNLITVRIHGIIEPEDKQQKGQMINEIFVWNDKSKKFPTFKSCCEEYLGLIREFYGF